MNNKINHKASKHRLVGIFHDSEKSQASSIRGGKKKRKISDPATNMQSSSQQSPAVLPPTLRHPLSDERERVKKTSTNDNAQHT